MIAKLSSQLYKAAGLLVLTTFIAMACKTTAPSKLDHEVGKPTNGNSPFQWVDIDDEILVGQYASTVFPGPPRILAPDHPMTVKYQKVVDEIDRYARRINPELLKNTPKPKIRIYNDDNFLNAWASGIPVCLSAEVAFQTLTPDSEAVSSYAVMLDQNHVEPLRERTPGFFGQPPKFLEPCFETKNSSKVAEFVKWMNDKNGDCKYQLVDEKVLVSGEGCEVKSWFQPFSGSTRARHFATIPYIFISTGFINFIDDESAVISVVGHELGHFYKSHTTNAPFFLKAPTPKEVAGGPGITEDSYNFFYNQSVEPKAGRPKPRPDSHAILEKVFKFRPNQDNPFRSVSGLQMSPPVSIYMASLQYGRDIKCDEAKKPFDEGQFYRLVNFPPSLDAKEIELFKDFETKFLECAKNIKLSETADDKTGDIDIEKLSRSFNSQMKSQIPSPPKADNLYDFLVAANSQMLNYTREENDFYDFMIREKIGLYSAEQEADELELEFMDALKIDPTSSFESYLKKGYYREKEDPKKFKLVNGVSMSECESLFRNNWIDPKTKTYRFIPIGDLRDLHHSPCYRLFNLTRELKAHGYKFNQRDIKLELN